MIATLIRLDRADDAQAHRWKCFEREVSAPHLRAYLKALPDFDDVEAEERAIAYTLTYPDVLPALGFFLDWPDLLAASQVVISRSDEIDGEDYELINYAADLLRERYPLAAVLLLRSMIDFAVINRRSARNKYVVNHLQDCERLDFDIDDYGVFPTHERYRETLRNRS